MFGDNDNVLMVTGDEELSRRASAWRPGEPFPLPAGPSADRYRGLLEANHLHGWPAVDPTRRDGPVISTGSTGAYAAGMLLARATDRTHRHIEDPARLADAVAAAAHASVAVVGLAADLSTVGDWVGMAGPRVGVVTARDVASLVCLVYRTLTARCLMGRSDFVVMHPSDEEADLADAVAFDEFGPLYRDGARVLFLRTHGVQCSANLPDGILCGRSDHLGARLPRPVGEDRFVACQQDAGCYRVDLDESQRVPAADVNASVVFVESCASVAVGNNALPTEIGLGLGFLSGTAVAVVGSLGLHLPDPSYLHVFAAVVRQGVTLGEAVETLNRYALDVAGDMARFGLLGDPTVVVAPRASPQPDRRPAVVADPDPARPPDHELAEVARLNALPPRLQRLQWLGVEVPEDDLGDLRSEIRAAAMTTTTRPDEARAAQIRETALAIQSRIVRQQVERMHHTWWQFAGGFLRFRRVTTVPARCPLCGRDCAYVGTFTHRIETDLTVVTLQCRRCEDVWWSVGEPTVRLSSPQAHWLARGHAHGLTAQLSNLTGRRLSGAIGFGVLGGWRTGLPVGRSRTLDLGPGATQEIDWPMEVSSTAQPHEHKSAFVSLLDGFYSAWMYRLYVT